MRSFFRTYREASAFYVASILDGKILFW